ncbi:MULTISPECIES: hypothetical protein [unclassified Lysobacter]|uniref:hypothetical protein n=1 Tax=unclassified Lysobacter TaxID=2635362 RepID=UPI0006F39754|nr:MULTISPECIES: hypothetical protein [unclassified Lysobacter]KQZ56465.1 hypothetical protein ASD53_13035 [Lysobacter sp. Root559]KRC35092.1 hypothetical protein ASE10_10505 [Lysobacter sp. Root76]KRD70780.1 hypothetical protein ASE45_02670 [Lysobacter sp. Root96]
MDRSIAPPSNSSPRSPVRVRLLALVASIAAVLGIGQSWAQDFAFGWDPRSGDAWVDTWLSDVNRYGTRYREPFVDEMVRNYGAPRELVSELLATRRWAPGDVYYACAMAQVLGRPCRYVVDEWERSHGEGWGAVAQRLGLKPGSPEFHRLKRGFVPTYDRWGRPIAIDAELRRDFPNRPTVKSKRPLPPQAHEAGKAKAKGQGKGHAKGKGKD